MQIKTQAKITGAERAHMLTVDGGRNGVMVPDPISMFPPNTNNEMSVVEEVRAIQVLFRASECECGSHHLKRGLFPDRESAERFLAYWIPERDTCADCG